MDTDNIDSKQFVYTRDVCCDDEHPIVYYSIPTDTNEAVCGYCNKTFVYVEAEI